MQAVQLHAIKQSVYCQIVTLVLRLKNVDFQLIETNVFACEEIKASHAVLHPFKKIPVLTHGDFTLYETVAITRYIDESFAGRVLQPTTAAQRAKMTQIISLMDSYAYQPMVWGIYVECSVRPARGEQPTPEVVTAAIEAASVCLNVLAELLAEQSYFCSEQLTLADCHVQPMLECLGKCLQGKALLRNHPNLQQWLLRMQQQVALAR
ncbi:hypothetical protein A9R01_10130 ['Osedax' symbiont bacterium Rs2_46_30_T18]|nr:hypothetical protein A9R01_10130 ['Osedax' symbiont bacterium Rs2_46_30_T18]